MRYNLEEAGKQHKHLQYPRFFQIIINGLLHDKVLNKDDKKIKLQHMIKSVFANYLSHNKRSEIDIIEVALFGPIIGEPFVEEEEDDDEGTDENWRTNNKYN